MQFGSKKNNNKKSNNKNLRNLYIVALIPLLILDFIFVFLVISNDETETKFQFESSAETIEYIFKNSVDYATKIATSISLDYDLYVFLEKEYDTTYDYYNEYHRVVQNPGIFKTYSLNYLTVDVYADNDTLINGGGVYQLDSVRDEGWYKYYESSGKDSLLFFGFDDKVGPTLKSNRHLFYVLKMDYYPDDDCEKICKIELNYGKFTENIENATYELKGYLCQDGMIVASSLGNNDTQMGFQYVDMNDIEYSREFSLCGNSFLICLPKRASGIASIFNKNYIYLIFLIIVNLIYPIVFIKLGQMIQAGRIKEQEMDIARQNAELLALHSQINPHFLFNALESIRMHSVLKGEHETAEMVEKLAVIERKNADWNEDSITVENEMDFVEAYLKLQKYRFGGRLSYEIDVEDDCRNIQLPRLTIVTFVENACVHGVEGKSTPCWIFVRVYRQNEEVIIEVEDTGEGIGEDVLMELREKMENASIDRLKSKGRIGVINACLRLKIFTSNTVRFSVESEQGIGTTVQVFIPKEYTEK